MIIREHKTRVLIIAMILAIIVLCLSFSTVIASNVVNNGVANVDSICYDSAISNVADVTDDEFLPIPDATYTGTPLRPNIVVGQYVNGIDYIVEYYRGSDATVNLVDVGTIEVRVVFINGRDDTLTRFFKINPKPYLFDPPPSIKDAVYNGQPQKPLVKIGNYTEGFHYKLEYLRGSEVTTDFTSSGVIICRVTMINNFIGTTDIVYNIYPAHISGSDNGINYTIISGNGFGFNVSGGITTIEQSDVNFNLYFNEGDEVLSMHKLTLTNSDGNYIPNGQIYIRIDKPRAVSDAKKVKIIYSEGGVITTKTCEIDKDQLVFSATRAGEFAIIATNDAVNTDTTAWVIPVLILLAIAVAALIIILTFVFFYKSGSRYIPRK